LLKDAIKEDPHDISTLERSLPAKTRKQIIAKFRQPLTYESAQRPWTFEEECKLIAWIHANGRKWKQAEKAFTYRAQQCLRTKYEAILNRAAS
jgi:hypothetical protein